MRLGTGLQNKLLEAMSMKLPTITTTLANNALCAINEKEILVGESAHSLSNHIIRLLNNPTTYHQIAENGHRFVKKQYNWGETALQLESIFNNNYKN